MKFRALLPLLALIATPTLAGPTDTAKEADAVFKNFSFGTGETLPLAPGDWEFSAPLASGTTTCIRDIQADGDLAITFVDGAPGCGGPPPAVDPLAPPAEGEVPADGTAPVEPAAG